MKLPSDSRTARVDTREYFVWRNRAWVIRGLGPFSNSWAFTIERLNAASVLCFRMKTRKRPSRLNRNPDWVASSSAAAIGATGTASAATGFGDNRTGGQIHAL